jgi:hypothetical protein
MRISRLTVDERTRLAEERRALQGRLGELDTAESESDH